MNIGILLPLSNAHPGISKDFMDGLNTFLAQKQLTGDVTIKKESVGFGGTEKEVYTKAEKLLISDDVDILIAYIDEKVTGMLYSLIQSTGKLLLIVNPGANHPVNWIAQPTVIHLTLHHAFLCWLTGSVAAKSKKKEAALASSFYDCGYLHCADMVKNFMVSGGIIQHNYINNQAYDESFDIDQLTDFLTFSPGCEKLLCVYDELPASLFYDRINNHKSEHALHLFVSPMMLTGKAIEKKEAGYNFSIHGYLSWQPEMDTEENNYFIKSCSKPASIFTLLGWETALIIDEIIQQCKDNFKEGEAIVAHLKINSVNGPRGKLKLDEETLYYTAPVGKFILEAGSINSTIEWKPDIEKEWKDFTAIQTEGAVTGWTNTYLCY